MKDSRLEKRIKDYRSVEKNILSYRENVGLSLRKDKIYEEIMKKRLNNMNVEIDISKLNLTDKQIEEYDKSEDKLILIKNWINSDSNDLKLYAIHKLRINSEEYNRTDDEDLEIDQDFIFTILYELFETKDLAVKCELSNIILNLTYKSQSFTMSLSDYDYLCKFIELTYCNCTTLIENALIIFGNIICDRAININELIHNIPIIKRIKELLERKNYVNLRINLYWLIRVMIDSTDSCYKCKFEEVVVIIGQIDETDEKNYSSLLETLKIISDDEITLGPKLLLCGVANKLLSKINNSNSNDIIMILFIIGNLTMVNDAAVEYLLNMNLIEILIKLIYSHMNSVIVDSKNIISNAFWVISNLTGGLQIHTDRVINSNMSNLVFQIFKFKKDLVIIKEIVNIIYNSICTGGPETFSKLIKLNVIGIIADILHNYINEGILVTTLKILAKIIERCVNLFFLKENLHDYNIISKIENMSINGSNEISNISEIIKEKLNKEDMNDY